MTQTDSTLPKNETPPQPKFVVDPNTRFQIKRFLNEAFVSIPVNWDRVVGVEEIFNILYIYGWIPRKDKSRDFVQLEFDKEQKRFNTFTTSSAKYSDAIDKCLFGKNADHYPCVKFSDYFKISGDPHS